MSTAPLEYRTELACPPARAFDTYTDLGSWWDPMYTADAQTFTGVRVERRLGGSIVEEHADGAEYVWGTITLWQPGMLLSHSFLLAHETGVASQVLVRFAPAAGGTELHLQHGGWNEDNLADRSRFTDWPVLLEGLRRRVGAID
ncbi:SRPBCC domain-containing protein [Auraticoccus cholistanensis]|uniref:SRPBCC domain-containing protein n=1 Tax=Auraticoccus cholistanensis TaxID=2656650 RepID=UPI0012E8E1A0